jgi:putative component of membrane protein insertase Oxa1/YidC/SpoIIIJ protein YidD
MASAVAWINAMRAGSLAVVEALTVLLSPGLFCQSYKTIRTQLLACSATSGVTLIIWRLAKCKAGGGGGASQPHRPALLM